MGLFRIFNGKVILFGEYSVMAGSSVLIIPYRLATAQLSFAEGKADDSIRRSNDVLSRFSDFLDSNKEIREFIDTESFTRDVAHCLYMNSSIPEHKGLGSSGALCAAVYDSYKRSEVRNMHNLQQLFAGMESFFHGTSSGVDPISIYAGAPVIIENSDYKLPEMVNENKLFPFLIDSGITCETAPLVNEFRNFYNQSSYKSEFRHEYVPLVDISVESWKNGILDMKQVSALSDAQTRFLSPMIPDAIKPVWNAGPDTGLYSIKLCGSGGGGMFLGFTENPEETRRFLRKRFGIEMISL
jgi:mevalonate kinase